jgi:hypothetical protein
MLQRRSVERDSLHALHWGHLFDERPKRGTGRHRLTGSEPLADGIASFRRRFYLDDSV